jgi:hypothetical protein
MLLLTLHTTERAELKQETSLEGGGVKITKKQKMGGERFTMNVNLKSTRENITQATSSPRRQDKI